MVGNIERAKILLGLCALRWVPLSLNRFSHICASTVFMVV